MGFMRRIVATGVIATVAGGAYLATRQGGQKVKTLSSEEFNSLFDRKSIITMLRQVKALSVPPTTSTSTKGNENQQPKVIFYRLLGCPYCARVRIILEMLHIQFTEVLVDPLSGDGIVDSRYPFVPQLQLTSSEADAAASQSLIVDSSEIIRVLASVYDFQNEIDDARIAETRKWIADRFQGVTFAAMNSSWSYAFHSYPDLVPPKYSNIVFRLVGSTALYGLANWKILPKLKDSSSSDSQKLLQEKNICGWLAEEAKVFTSKTATANGRFHGGKTPDLADVEMFGVLRNIVNHADLKSVCLTQGTPLAQWYEEMSPYARGEKRWK